MTVAVVILNWNGRKLLEQFLPGIIKFSSNAVIYVADNASTDGSVGFVANHFPSIKIIQNRSNLGFASGYNEALKSVDEDLYVLLNSDVEVTENWLDPVISIFHSEKNVAIAQPKIMDWKSKGYFEYAGAAGGFIDKYGFPFCRGRIFQTIELDEDQYQDGDVFWASGACFFIRRDVYRELNGFDDDFFAHQEEIDLCWRAFNRNYRAVACMQSKVYHLGGATLEKSNPKKTYLNFRNSLCMLTKNLPKNQLFQRLLARLLFDGLAGIKFLFDLRPLHCLAIVKAHFSFYGYYRRMKSKRDSAQRRNYFHVPNIVWLYYVKGVKKFKNLI